MAGFGSLNCAHRGSIMSSSIRGVTKAGTEYRGNGASGPFPLLEGLRRPFRCLSENLTFSAIG